MGKHSFIFLLLCSLLTLHTNPAIDNADKSIPMQQSSEPTMLAKRLYQAQLERSPQQFFSILQTAASTFANDPRAFEVFLNTRNDLGWTALMHASMTGDMVQITAILRIVQRYYNDDQQAIFRYVNQRSKLGYTALTLACELGKLVVIKTLVDYVAELLHDNKKLFLQFLNTPDFLNENNPLIVLTYDSQSRAMEYLVKKAKKFFGKNSLEFDSFINYEDVNGFTSLQYALNPIDRNFLIKNKAKITKRLSTDILDAQKFGVKIIDAISNTNLGHLKRLLYNLEHTYQNKKDLFIVAIEARNGAGWSAVLHAAVQQSMVFMQSMVSTIQRVLYDDPSDVFDELGVVDFLGRSGLMMSIQRESFMVGHYLTEELLKYSKNIYYFYAYIITQVEGNGFSALFMAVYKCQGPGPLYDFIKFLMQKMDTIFGKDSRAFYYFINELDFNHYTPLDYADAKEVIALLHQYGAKHGAEVHAERNKELAIAKQL